MVEQRAQRSRHIDLVIMKATFSGGEWRAFFKQGPRPWNTIDLPDVTVALVQRVSRCIRALDYTIMKFWYFFFTEDEAKEEAAEEEEKPSEEETKEEAKEAEEEPAKEEASEEWTNSNFFCQTF